MSSTPDIPGSVSPRVEISLDNLLYNAGQIRALAPGRELLAVVKDCAYGCGAVEIARTLQDHGNVRYFAVARAEEAHSLRDAGIRGEILILGRTGMAQLRKGVAANLTFTLTDLQDLALWSESGLNIRFHCCIDTGMSRMGLLPDEIPSLAGILTAPGSPLRLEGVFTHLANADEPGTATVPRQLELFYQCLRELRDRNVHPEHIHYGNSATIMRFRPQECSMIRPGIALYGCKPDPAQDFAIALRPVASLKSSIVKMKKVPAGTPVSYGGTYLTTSETWIATIALGYAHGLPRSLGNKGDVLIRGKRYRIAGRVTMDYIMVDAGESPQIGIGDEVVAMGYQGQECISPDELAIASGTIGYEILCNLGTSIERRYLFKGKTVIKSGFLF
jgi:alanine racemase